MRPVTIAQGKGVGPILRRTVAVIAALSIASSWCPTISKARSPSSDQATSSVKQVAEWARRALVPLPSQGEEWSDAYLKSLGDMIGGARVVALTEGVHGAAEPLEFRNRLLRFLVEAKGFTAIAIESGSVEGRTVHDYVRGGRADEQQIVESGLSWTFDGLPQNRSLIHWLQTYNADPAHTRKVNFYGFDVPGSPGNVSAVRGIDTALVSAMTYLDSVDAATSAEFHQRIGPFLGRLQFDYRHPTDAKGYATFGRPERDVLTTALKDLSHVFVRNATVYTKTSGADAYDWAYQAVVGAQEIDDWLRSMPVGRRLHWADTDVIARRDSTRERAQARNLEWILEREGGNGRVLAFGHVAHLSTAPIRPQWTDCRQLHPMGQFVRNRLQKGLFSIGNVIGSGIATCAGLRCCDGKMEKLGPGLPGSIESMSFAIYDRGFLLDLRAAPANVARELRLKYTLGRNDDVFSVRPAKAFDALLYMATVESACED